MSNRDSESNKKRPVIHFRMTPEEKADLNLLMEFLAFRAWEMNFARTKDRQYNQSAVVMEAFFTGIESLWARVGSLDDDADFEAINSRLEEEREAAVGVRQIARTWIDAGDPDVRPPWAEE